MADCIFCRIVRGEAPARIEYQDDEVVVFWDIRPKAPVHLLLVPRKHIPTLRDVQEEDLPLMGHLVQVANRVAEQMGLRDGFRIVVNVGPGGGQEVWHLHVHLLGRPRP